MAQPKKPKRPKPPPRFFSIGEWFGSDITGLSSQERLASAQLAKSSKVKVRPCPFRPGKQCNKRGGVCSLRQYRRSAIEEPIALGDLVTVCPARFFDGDEIFRWVGDVMLG